MFLLGTLYSLSEALPSRAGQTDGNRTESISPQRRRVRRDDSSFFFAAETPAKKNAHALRARSDRFKQLTQSIGPFPFLPSSAPWNGRSLFPRGQQKREKRFPLLGEADPTYLCFSGLSPWQQIPLCPFPWLGLRPAHSTHRHPAVPCSGST